jgi:hypothetical protein
VARRCAARRPLPKSPAAAGRGELFCPAGPAPRRGPSAPGVHAIQPNAGGCGGGGGGGGEGCKEPAHDGEGCSGMTRIARL